MSRAASLRLLAEIHELAADLHARIRHLGYRSAQARRDSARLRRVQSGEAEIDSGDVAAFLVGLLLASGAAMIGAILAALAQRWVP